MPPKAKPTRRKKEQQRLQPRPMALSDVPTAGVRPVDAGALPAPALSEDRRRFIDRAADALFDADSGSCAPAATDCTVAPPHPIVAPTDPPLLGVLRGLDPRRSVAAPTSPTTGKPNPTSGQAGDTAQPQQAPVTATHSAVASLLLQGYAQALHPLRHRAHEEFVMAQEINVGDAVYAERAVLDHLRRASCCPELFQPPQHKPSVMPQPTSASSASPDGAPLPRGESVFSSSMRKQAENDPCMQSPPTPGGRTAAGGARVAVHHLMSATSMESLADVPEAFGGSVNVEDEQSPADIAEKAEEYRAQQEAAAAADRQQLTPLASMLLSFLAIGDATEIQRLFTAPDAAGALDATTVADTNAPQGGNPALADDAALIAEIRRRLAAASDETDLGDAEPASDFITDITRALHLQDTAAVSRWSACIALVLASLELVSNNPAVMSSPAASPPLPPALLGTGSPRFSMPAPASGRPSVVSQSAGGRGKSVTSSAVSPRAASVASETSEPEPLRVLYTHELRYATPHAATAALQRLLASADTDSVLSSPPLLRVARAPDMVQTTKPALLAPDQAYLLNRCVLPVAIDDPDDDETEPLLPPPFEDDPALQPRKTPAERIEACAVFERRGMTASVLHLDIWVRSDQPILNLRAFAGDRADAPHILPFGQLRFRGVCPATNTLSFMFEPTKVEFGFLLETALSDARRAVQVSSTIHARLMSLFVKPHYCHRHPTQPNTHFCETCDAFVCANCVRETHAPHVIIPRQQFCTAEAAVRVPKRQLAALRLQRVRELRAALDAQEDAAYRLVDRTLDDVVERVQERQEWLLRDVDHRADELRYRLEKELIATKDEESQIAEALATTERVRHGTIEKVPNVVVYTPPQVLNDLKLAVPTKEARQLLKVLTWSNASQYLTNLVYPPA